MRYEINKKATGPLYVTEADQIKTNSNCPDSEKSGHGPGSCGGSKGTSTAKEGKITTTTKMPTEKYEKIGAIGAKSAIKNDVDINRITKEWGKMTTDQKNQFVNSSWDVDEMGTNVYPDHPEYEPETPEQENLVKESFKKNLIALMDQRHADYKKRYNK